MYKNTDSFLYQICVIMEIVKMNETNNNHWRENKAIGNIAEIIIEMLIKSMSDWKCIRFGMENHIEELKKNIRKNINPRTKKIKSMPDFIAFNTKTEETFFVEVKYFSFIDKRIQGKSEYRFGYKRLNEYMEYWKGTKLIVVCPFEPYFIVIDLSEVKENMRRKEEVELNKWADYWNFIDIQKDIRDIFKDLSEEMIQKAIEMIPKKNGR